jgi:hypothetical protein
MGYVEIVTESGIKVQIDQHEIVSVDQVPLSECCELCNDPRMVHFEGLLKCVGCGVINRIDYGKHA